MADALADLKSRLADIHSLDALSWLLDWDQPTTMPPAGGTHRADHVELLQRLAHERLTDPEVGRLLDELAPLEQSLDEDSIDASSIRVARRDRDKAVRVPAELRGEMARAAAASGPAWLGAKAAADFRLITHV